MPLRDVVEYLHWVEREAPSTTAQRVARKYLVGIADEPWRSPSVPIPGLSTQPVDEVRSACLQVPGEDEPVQLFYRHEYASGAVDVIAITNR